MVLLLTKPGRNIPLLVFFKSCSQHLIQSKTLVAIGTKWNFLKEFCKNLLLWNRWSDFEIISQDCFLCDPFQKLFVKFWSVEKHGRWGGGGEDFLHYTDMKKCFKNLLWNPWSDFEIILQDCSMGDLFKNCSRNFDPSKNMVAKGGGGGGGGFLHCMDLKKFFKNLFLWNRLSEFGIISQDCSLCDPFRKLLTKFWSVKKHGRRGGGGGGGRDFLHCVDSREILRNSSPPKLLIRFWNNFTGLFLG